MVAASLLAASLLAVVRSHRAGASRCRSLAAVGAGAANLIVLLLGCLQGTATVHALMGLLDIRLTGPSLFAAYWLAMFAFAHAWRYVGRLNRWW